MAHADHVLVNGEPIGWSSGTAYSSRFRQIISMGCIDVAAATIGTELTVLWGNHGEALKEIKATVERFPYMTEGRNSDLDVVPPNP